MYVVRSLWKCVPLHSKALADIMHVKTNKKTYHLINAKTAIVG